MVNKLYKYSEITSVIINCAIEVHKILGNGFQEVIYQRALAKEMMLHNLNFDRESEMQIYYKNEMIGTRRVDFLVENVISVELKAVTKFEKVHFTQAINYLEVYNIDVGLLINFGANSLEFKRFVKKELYEIEKNYKKISE